MLRLPETLPNLSENESSELIHKLLIDRINIIVDMAEDPDDPDWSIYDGYFPEYLFATDVPRKKLIELSKMLVSSGEYTPDLEIEYAINKIVQDLRHDKELTMETVREYYNLKGHDDPDPDDFFECLWDSIFWDNDFEFLDEGFTLQMLENSPMDEKLGITGGLSAFPHKDENQMQ